MILEYVRGPLVIPFWTIQLGICSLIPILLLSLMIWRGTKGNALIGGVVASALLVLVGVLMMRWNVVIGGQEIAKTGKGLLTYHMPFAERESGLTAAILLAAPMVLLAVAVRLFPPWDDAKTAH